MRGCGMDEKKCMIVDLFKERKLDILALSETKVKGQGVQEWEGERVIVSGVAERCRAREGVAIIVSGRLWGSVIDYKCVSSRIVWVRMKVAGEKLIIVSVYGPGMEKSENERESFWSNLNDCVAGFGENERYVILGDMNAKVGDRPRDEVVGKYGVPNVDENGDRLIEMCIERRLIVGNTWFEKKLINKYTWARGGDERSLIDYVLVQNKRKKELVDVTVRRGITAGISDHYLVEAKVRLKGCWRNGSRVTGKKVIKVKELEKREKREAFKELIKIEWERVKGIVTMSPEEEWEVFKSVVLEVAGKVCGFRYVGRKGKRSEWWDEEMRGLVGEKRSLHEVHLQSGNVHDRERYKIKKREVKRRVKEKKRLVDVDFGVRMNQYFRENKKRFYSEVNAERRVKEQLELRIKDENGCLLTEENAVKARWNEYFNELLNVDDGREAELTEGRIAGVNAEVRQEVDINVNDVKRAVKKLKNGKTPGVDGITNEMLRYGGECMVEWLTRVIVVCFKEGRVPKDWMKAIIIPIYKGKGDKGECKNYRGISLLSMPGKVYGRVLIEKVEGLTERFVREEQCGFRKGRGCVDQVFVMNQLIEKFGSKGKVLYASFMDLEKAYDRVNRSAMWKVLEQYGVSGKLLQAVKSFYVESEACVRVCRQESDWFGVKVGLRQGCVMSPWLFNVFIDGVMREVQQEVRETGVSLWDASRNCALKVGWLMYADDTVLVAGSEVELQKLVDEFGRVCRKRKLSVNISKSKVMKIGGNQGTNDLNVSLNNRRMEEVDTYRYLGVDISSDGKMHEELCHRMKEARKNAGMLKSLWNRRNVSREAKVGMFEGIVEPSLLYGSETWVTNKSERKKMEAVEMDCLRSICGVRRLDMVTNAEVRRRSGKEVSVGAKMDQSVLRWFGHVERMDEERLVRRVYESNVEGTRRRGRPRKCWMDGVLNVLNEKGLDIQRARECVHDRSGWRSIWRGRRAADGAPP